MLSDYSFVLVGFLGGFLVGITFCNFLHAIFNSHHRR